MSEDALDMIQDRQTAAERVIEGVVLALDAAKVLPLQALLPVLELLQAQVRVAEEDGERIADCMSFVIDRLKAHAATRAAGAAPLAMLQVQREVFDRLPPTLRAALASFAEFGSPDEIAEELDELLRRRSAAPGARGSPAEDAPGGSAAGDE